MVIWLERGFNLELNIENNIFFQLPYELEETIACMCFSP